LQTADFDFSLPPDRIAAAPADVRDDARLMVMDRRGEGRKHLRFRDILDQLPSRSVLVLNDARVLAARLHGRKPTGGAVEFLLTRRIETGPLGGSPMPPAIGSHGQGPRSPDAVEMGSGGGASPAAIGPEHGLQNDRFCELWEGLTRGLASAAVTGPIAVGGGVEVEVVERREAGRALLRLTGPGVSLDLVLDQIGELPLPPYIEAARKRMGSAAPAVDDRARYQTVYAAHAGAVAAPTAGLHFTPPLLAAIKAAGHEIAALTLDVGPGTFRPVEVDDPRAHRLDAERYRIPLEAADAIARARAEGRPVVAVGTTVVRSLEASARANGGAVAAGDTETDLCLLPGDEFQVVTDLITNFHLPKSTLLMLVAAFAGKENVLAAYREAVDRGYRFYSYGDAMLIRGSA
jgi:S-adenosylmethionine:tRNA ribosyltransferase-isomerase